jgi:hypothetical protein
MHQCKVFIDIGRGRAKQTRNFMDAHFRVRKVYIDVGVISSQALGF